MSQDTRVALASLSVADLTELKVQYLACLLAIGNAHQSYSFAGRTFTRANLAEVKDTLADVAWALEYKSGAFVKVVYSDMSCP